MLSHNSQWKTVDFFFILFHGFVVFLQKASFQFHWKSLETSCLYYYNYTWSPFLKEVKKTQHKKRCFIYLISMYLWIPNLYLLFQYEVIWITGFTGHQGPPGLTAICNMNNFDVLYLFNPCLAVVTEVNVYISLVLLSAISSQAALNYFLSAHTVSLLFCFC